MMSQSWREGFVTSYKDVPREKEYTCRLYW